MMSEWTARRAIRSPSSFPYLGALRVLAPLREILRPKDYTRVPNLAGHGQPAVPSRSYLLWEWSVGRSRPKHRRHAKSSMRDRPFRGKLV